MLGLPLPCFVLLSWVAIVRTFRWRRYNHIYRVYGPQYEAGMLSIDDAQKILWILSRYEMPSVMELSTAFVIFKTDAIPSISKLLASTVKSVNNIARRHADTFILTSTWLACPINGLAHQVVGVEKPISQDPRANLAIARTNWIHSRYKIKNDDHLYTLALFMLEPVRWAAKYGWRPLSPLEVHASFIFWVEIGRRMGIKDIPNSVEEYQQWEKDYEDRYMVPAQTNVETGMWTVEEFLFSVPEAFGIKNLFRKGFFAVIEDNIRVAMMQPEQPKCIFILFDSILRFMAWYTRYFRLPAIFAYYSQVQAKFPQFKGDEPVMTPSFFMSKPWYKPKSSYLWDWLMVKIGRHDSMPRSELKSEGYRLDTIGPPKYERDGQEEVFQMAEKMLGCPIKGAWRKPLKEQDRPSEKKRF